jgi:hypothetical protein
MVVWRIFLSAFLGKVFGSLFIAICIAFGFGPQQWAEYLIAGMPVFITPGVVRLAFLLLASITLASMLRESIALASRPKKWILIAIVCLPFIVGAFFM